MKTKSDLLKQIGKYTAAAGTALLTGNMTNAAVVTTNGPIDLTFGVDHGIDFDGDGLNELIIYVYTSIYGTGDPAAFLTIGSDPDATSFEVIQGGPFGASFSDPAALSLNRLVGPTLDGSSYWTSVASMGWGGAAIAWTYFSGAGTAGGNFIAHAGETRYAGIRFSNNGGTTYHYGWIGINLNAPVYVGTGTVGLVTNYGYETMENHRIAAGSATTVPLAPIASVIGLGLVGLFGYFKSRRKKEFLIE